MINIEDLKQSVIDFQSWIDNGFEELNETDIYPSDLYYAIATPSNILELINELIHVKANNENLTERNRILRCRPDLNIDRLPYIKRIDELEEENKALKARIDGVVRVSVHKNSGYEIYKYSTKENYNATLIIDDGIEL